MGVFTRKVREFLGVMPVSVFGCERIRCNWSKGELCSLDPSPESVEAKGQLCSLDPSPESVEAKGKLCSMVGDPLLSNVRSQVIFDIANVPPVIREDWIICCNNRFIKSSFGRVRK